jgi:hypothetical protein
MQFLLTFCFFPSQSAYADAAALPVSLSQVEDGSVLGSTCVGHRMSKWAGVYLI